MKGSINYRERKRYFIMKLFFIVTTIFLLLANPIETVEYIEVVKGTETENVEEVKPKKSDNRNECKNISRSSEEKELRKINVEVTAYDLSIQSCGKALNHPGRGITKSGFNLNGMSRKDAMTVAADPKVIPLGSKVKIEFLSDTYKEYEGVYNVRDVGGGVKKNKIDLYVGDYGEKVSKEAINFGRTKAVITILEEKS